MARIFLSTTSGASLWQSLYTTAGVNTYVLPDAVPTGIDFVQFDNLPLTPDQYSFNAATNEITIISPFDIEPGQYINVAYH